GYDYGEGPGVPGSSERRRRALGVVGEPLPDDPQLDLQRGDPARAIRREPRPGDSSVPGAAGAGPLPERRGVPAPAGQVQGPGASDGDRRSVHDDFAAARAAEPSVEREAALPAGA